MFKTLSENFRKIFDNIKGSGVLSEQDISNVMREVRIALLEADVTLPVVKAFINAVQEKAVGQEIVKSVSPSQMVIKIIHDEIVSILSSDLKDEQLNIYGSRPINFLLAGLQGSGKTTASAKLALNLKNQNYKVLLVSLDTYRPAAKDQLKKLAMSIDVDCFKSDDTDSPIEITNKTQVISKDYDVVIYDSAGRLHVDDSMLEELITIKQILKPKEVLLILDAMIGQDVINVASTFNQKLDITGTILSRIDGDMRGGVALSVKHMLNKPIKFLSVGEKLTDFELFDAKRIASRILDMGDIVSFVEKAAAVIDQEAADKLAKRIQKGKFDLNDYRKQISSIKKLGGFSSILGMIPGASNMMNKLKGTGMDEKILMHQEAIILSMTPKERKLPNILNAKRKQRIAKGSGTSIQQINIMLKQFKQINSVMKKTQGMGNLRKFDFMKSLFR